ncbi:unnamed protein product [Linum trigynum]|uniref:EXPERA domain-containing protein n=1 Tax=Linum trigynum TaxID=586398 RepID=A0AAV2F6E9_9ROSI
MSAFVKLVDFPLFLVFFVVALAAALLNAQTCLPASYFPEALINFKEWYRQQYGDYLFSEKPNFFVGTVWLELVFQWPLALLNLNAILRGKPWFNTSCLIYGVSITSSMVVNQSPSFLRNYHMNDRSPILPLNPNKNFGVENRDCTF